MDPVRNPYQPGAGRRPPELAGRADVIADVRVAMERCVNGTGDRGRVVHGLRGVGKTVLLNEFLSLAEQAGWIDVKVEGSPARPQVARHIAQGLHRALRQATGRYDVSRLKRALGVFRAFSIRVDPAGSYSFGFDVAPASGHADSGDLTTDLTDLFTELGRAAADLGVGVMLLVDEMQELGRHELAALNLAAHEVGQGTAPLPVLVIGAGLPSLPAILAEAATYAERLFEFRSIGALTPGAAADALVRPAAHLGVHWDDDALSAVLEASGGYPFALQSCGKFVWD
ncbi:MAG: ATP-binding protein, partial [Actinomycetota bacterium]|nr:ATP-binding protein [Actinomycetota bacterium]